MEQSTMILFSFFLFILTCLLGAAVGTLVKFLVNEIPPLSVVADRFILGLLFILPFTFRYDLLKKFKKDKFLLLGSIFFSLNVILYATGIQFTSLIMGQLLYVPSSIVVALIGYFFLKEKVNSYQIIGLMLSLFGMSILIYGSITTSNILSFGKPLGNFLIFLAMISWSTYTVFSKKNSNKFTPNEITLSNFLTASIVSVAAFPIVNLFSASKFYSQDVGTNIMILVLVIIALLFIISYQWLIKKTSAFTSSLTSYLSPFLAYFLGAIFFNEILTVNLVIGGLFIIIGVFIATSLNQVKKSTNKLWNSQ